LGTYLKRKRGEFGWEGSYSSRGRFVLNRGPRRKVPAESKVLSYRSEDKRGKFQKRDITLFSQKKFDRIIAEKAESVKKNPRDYD